MRTIAASSRTVLTFLEANPEIKVDVIEKDFTKDELRWALLRKISGLQSQIQLGSVGLRNSKFILHQDDF